MSKKTKNETQRLVQLKPLVICVFLHYYPKIYVKDENKEFVEIDENLKTVELGKFNNIEIASHFGNSIKKQHLEEWNYVGEYDAIEIKRDNLIEAMRSI